MFHEVSVHIHGPSSLRLMTRVATSNDQCPINVSSSSSIKSYVWLSQAVLFCLFAFLAVLYFF